MDELHVIARVDVVNSGGGCVARAGTHGYALPNKLPTRQDQYGRVPIRWVGHRRSFWTEPDSLIADGLDPYRAMPKEAARAIAVPLCHMAQSDIHVGRMIRRLRQTRNLSQQGLCTRMAGLGFNVSQTTLSNWERRSDCPAGAFVRAVAEALQVQPFLLLAPADCDSLEEGVAMLQTLRAVACPDE